MDAQPAGTGQPPGCAVRTDARAVHEPSKLVIKEPKSQAGIRSVALPQWLIPELLTHLEQYAEPGPAGRVFVGAKGSTPRRGHWTKIWRAAKAKAGVDEAVHFHDLRHTGNHLAAASGASTRELMGRMGHSSVRAALIYQHRTADRDRLIADALDSLIDASQRTRSGAANGHERQGPRS